MLFLSNFFLYFYFIKSVNRSDELFREIQPPFSINLFFLFFFSFLILINAVINQSQSKGKMYLFRGGGFSAGGSFCSGDGVMIVHMRLSTIMTNFFSMFVSFDMSLSRYKICSPTEIKHFLKHPTPPIKCSLLSYSFLHFSYSLFVFIRFFFLNFLVTQKKA
jgi:hypothetical protein